MPGRLIPAAVLLSVAVAAAQAPQAPVFRSRIDVVPVTVTVVDRKGKPVTDLAVSDFVVTENGRRRDIVSFHPQMFGPNAPDSAVVSSVPARSRTFLIVLGWGRIQYPGKGVDGALSFARERLLPGDRVSVMAFHRATDFTTDHAKVVRVLERFRESHEQLMYDIRVHFLSTRGFGRGGPPIPDRILTKIDDQVFGPAEDRLPLRQIDGLVLGMDRPTPVVHKPGQQPTTFATMSTRMAAFGTNLRDATIWNNRLRLYAGVEHVRRLEGDKRIIFIAETGVAASREDARILANRASDGRVAIDFIWTAGTRPSGGSGCLPCRDLTEFTGGYYTSVENADKALAKIDEESRFAYLLGYAPVSPDLDGKYRDIRVTVSRPNVEVRYRHGYYAAAEPNPEELRAAVSRTYTEAASTYDLTANDIPIRITARPVPETGAPREMRVDLTIGVSDLGLLSEGGRHRGQLEIRLYCGDAKEKVVGSQVATMALNATPETLAEWKRTGLKHSLTVPVTAAPKFVKAIVFDPASNRAGSVVITLPSSKR